MATLSTLVSNAGREASPETTISFYDGDPDAGGRYLGSADVPSIDAYGLEAASIEWNLSGLSGTHDVYALVDPDGTVDEADEDNNRAQLSITIQEAAECTLTLSAFNTSAFPAMAATLSVEDENGEPISSFAARYVSVIEGGTDCAHVALEGTGTPGIFALSWTSPLSRIAPLGPTALS